MNNPGILDVLSSRRSSRLFSKTPTTLANLSFIMDHAAQVVKFSDINSTLKVMNADHEDGLQEPGTALRPYSTACGIGALNLFVLSLNVSDLPSGLYQYDDLKGSLNSIHQGPAKTLANEFFYNSKWVSEAGFAVIVAGNLDARKHLYRPTWKFLLIETGEVLQNLQLLSHAEKLSSCQIGYLNRNEFYSVAKPSNKRTVVPLAACAFGLPKEEK